MKLGYHARFILLGAISVLDACDGGASLKGGVSISPPEVTLAASSQQVFAAAPPTVSWRVKEGGAGGSIEPSGLYTAPPVPGSFTVVAVEQTSGATGEAPIVVTALADQVTHGLYIPNVHPRLWFNPARLARARAWYQTHPFTPPSRDYVGWALRGLLGNEPASCRTAIAWALAASGDGTFPIPGGTACDYCRWDGEKTLLIYDWCYAHMTPAERSTFRTNTTAWVNNWRQKSWGSPEGTGPENNYFLGYLRNELEWGIALYEDDPASAEVLLEYAFTDRLANSLYPSARSGRMRGGAGREGSMYGRHHYGYMAVPLVTTGLLGRDMFGEIGSYWQEVAYCLVYSTQPAVTTGAGNGQVANMGFTVWPSNDNEPSAWLGSAAAAVTTDQTDFMTAVAMRWPTGAVGQHARQWLNMTGAPDRSRHVQAVDADGGAALSFAGLPLDYYAAGALSLYTRNAWGSTATTAWLQMGEQSGGHAQAEWGTWQIWRNGRYLSRETVSYDDLIANYGGSGTVGSRYAPAHNTLLVNGIGNRPYTISGIFPAVPPTVRRLESQPGYSFASVDLTPLNNTAVTSFRHWERDFVFLRGLETLVVLDRIQSAAAGDTKTFLSHCEVAPTTGANTSTCQNGPQALVQTTLVPATSTYRVVNEGGSIGQYRIEVDTNPGTAESYILTVLQAKDGAAASLRPTVVDSNPGTPGTGTFTLTLNASTSITFEKGMISSGGSVTIGGATTPLRAGVQPMTVSEAGPAWQ